MLSRLLEGVDNIDQTSLEETRMRAAQLLSKVHAYTVMWLSCDIVIVHITYCMQVNFRGFCSLGAIRK